VVESLKCLRKGVWRSICYRLVVDAKKRGNPIGTIRGTCLVLMEEVLKSAGVVESSLWVGEHCDGGSVSSEFNSHLQYRSAISQTF
jgi:hypothetical protein